MASPWIADRVQQIKKSGECRLASQEWSLHCDKLIRSQGRNLFSALEDVVKADVEDFNSAFSEDRDKKIDFQSSASTKFVVRKPRFPSFHIECWFDADDHLIRFTVNSRKKHESDPRKSLGRFRIIVLDSGVLQLANGDRLITYEEASHLLLNPFLSPEHF